VERLRGHVRAVCLDVGTAPENYAGKIAKENPDTILLLDAVYLNRTPGEYALLGKADILSSGFTTHDISPRLFIEYLETQTRAKIYLLGVQPKNLSLDGEMSDPVSRAVDELASQIRQALHT
jgi:hydrogenase 3 maturation protease